MVAEKRFKRVSVSFDSEVDRTNKMSDLGRYLNTISKEPTFGADAETVAFVELRNLPSLGISMKSGTFDWVIEIRFEYSSDGFSSEQFDGVKDWQLPEDVARKVPNVSLWDLH